MTKRFRLEVEDNTYIIFDIQSTDEEDKLYGLDDEQVCELLNELHEENEHYKSIFFELVETALTDKNCRELYCGGILNIFDKTNSLNQARDMIKEFLE